MNPILAEVSQALERTAESVAKLLRVNRELNAAIDLAPRDANGAITSITLSDEAIEVLYENLHESLKFPSLEAMKTPGAVGALGGVKIYRAES